MPARHETAFAGTYGRTFADKITRDRQAGIDPAWNHPNAGSANASLRARFPV